MKKVLLSIFVSTYLLGGTVVSPIEKENIKKELQIKKEALTKQMTKDLEAERNKDLTIDTKVLENVVQKKTDLEVKKGMVNKNLPKPDLEVKKGMVNKNLPKPDLEVKKVGNVQNKPTGPNQSTGSDLEKKIDLLLNEVTEMKRSRLSYEKLNNALLKGDDLIDLPKKNATNGSAELTIEGQLELEEEKRNKNLGMVPIPTKIITIGYRTYVYCLIQKEVYDINSGFNKSYQTQEIKVQKGFKYGDWELTKITKDYVIFKNKETNETQRSFFGAVVNSSKSSSLSNEEDISILKTKKSKATNKTNRKRIPIRKGEK